MSKKENVARLRDVQQRIPGMLLTRTFRESYSRFVDAYEQVGTSNCAGPAVLRGIRNIRSIPDSSGDNLTPEVESPMAIP